MRAMKKITYLFVLMCFLSVQFFSISMKVQAKTEEPDNLYARSAVLMDADSGRILFGKEERTVHPMASTTKIMTCILALEHMSEGQTMEVSDYAVCQPKVRLGVKSGEEYALRDLLYSLMLESHNDSAVIVAEGIGGNVEGFAEMMNQKAKEIGCKDTHFVTPNGLDGEDEEGIHATTAADLALIMRYCIMESPKKEEFLEITRTKSYQFSDLGKKRNFSCQNHNAFLTMMEGALSGKTGFTADAGYCYVGALKRDDRTFIVALLACGWPNNKGYKWKDTKKLMQYGLDNYEYRDIWEPVKEQRIPVEYGVMAGDPYAMSGVVSVGLEENEEKLPVLLRKDEKVKRTVEIEEKFHAPVKKGEKAGSVTYTLDGMRLGKYEIVTLQKVQKRDISWCFRQIIEKICL